MIGILSKIWIKDSHNYTDKNVRVGYGILCGTVGICLNILLFIGKIFAGMMSSSIAITADAFNNLSDAGSSIITLIGFRMANSKPDEDHPYGHGRAEYISGLLVAVVIILMSYELFKDAVDKIIHPQPIEFGYVPVVVLIVSVLVKVYMAFYNSRIGKKIDSAAMRATATDSLSDCVATTIVLLASTIGYFTGVKLDGYLGVVVALVVFIAGINAARDTIDPLLGQPPKEEFVDEIEKIVMSYSDQGAVGIHDLIVHDYGPGRVFLSVHVEVPSDRDILQMHDMVDVIENDLRTSLNCHAVIHMDPVCIGDPETDKNKEIVRAAIEKLNEEFPKKTVSFHDFRMVKGHTHTNLIFDIVIPYNHEKEDSQVVRYIQNFVNNEDSQLFCAINVDKKCTK